MTIRLYHTDARLQTFQAVVQSVTAAGTGTRVVLDRTAFYPSSGGQPFDTGQLGGRQVTDVIDRDDDEIEHVLDGSLSVGETVTGNIDWPRRFDHMQQHTGQHVLSAAFDRVVGAETVGFHLGAVAVTIDLSREVTPTEIDLAESDANRVIWEDRPVRVRFVTPDEAARLPLRRVPARQGNLRLVEVADYDLSACGGTHVSHAGQVGLVAVTAWERFKGGMRISFACGGRALRAHRAWRDALSASSRVLSVTPDDLVAQVERLVEAARGTDRQMRGLRQELFGCRADRLRAAIEVIGGRRVVIAIEPNDDAASLKELAQAVVSGAPTDTDLVTVVVGAGEPVPVIIARGTASDLDANAVVKGIIGTLGGRGGGRRELAQAGVPADRDQIVRVLRQVLAS